MKILGMDLGQNKSAWEWLETQSGEVAAGWVKMEAAALQKLLADIAPDQLVATGTSDAGAFERPLYHRAVFARQSCRPYRRSNIRAQNAARVQTH